MRERCTELLAAGERGELAHFRVHSERMRSAAEYVARITRERYPDLRIPLHSRWRHFEVGGVDRWQRLTAEPERGDPAWRARAGIDLALVSVLLDAGAGARWHYRAADGGPSLARSEGLAVASLEMFGDGLFSATRGQPMRVDADALARFDSARLAAGFQVDAGNPLDGLDGRATLLRALASVLRERRDLFGEPARPGHLFDWVRGHAVEGRIAASELLAALLDGLGPIWPDRPSLGGIALGDCWPHPAIRRADSSDRLLPLHKLSQWLAYSLVEPLASGGIEVIELDGLTGLGEYRNGGLMIDLGVLELRDPGAAARQHSATCELVVEWRALTVALLDRLAIHVREVLGVGADRLPLACVLEGGSWAAGRAIAAQRRPGGEPPIRVIGDGTLF